MAAIEGKWYASVGTHARDAHPEDDDTVRFVYATQPDGEKYVVAKVWAGDDGDFESTARLVAAAPELLAACKRMMALIQEIDRALGRHPGIIFDAMGAIVKAEQGGAWPTARRVP
jgi:hypothetical protein